MTVATSPYLNRRLRSFAEAEAACTRHPVGVDRCRSCFWWRQICANAKSPCHGKIMVGGDGCLLHEEGR